MDTFCFIDVAFLVADCVCIVQPHHSQRFHHRRRCRHFHFDQRCIQRKSSAKHYVLLHQFSPRDHCVFLCKTSVCHLIRFQHRHTIGISFDHRETVADVKTDLPGGETSKMFAAVAAGLCIGVAIALAFKAGGSTGGADIVAVIIQKKFKATSIAWMLFIINCIVIGASIFIFEPPVEKSSALYYGALLMPIIMAIFESFVESKINEAITNGLHSAREFRIITDKPEEMAQALMKELSRGVTALPATGMYTKITHTMLLCVVSRRQVPTLKKIVKSVDPNSFAVMSNASQVLGLGFHNSDLQ